MKRTFTLVFISSLALSGCATLEKSTLLGAGIGGASGAGIGAAAGRNVGGTLIGLGIGALVGGAVGLFTHKDKEEMERQLRSSFKKNDPASAPSLTSPEVRRIFVPSKIDGTRFVEGHYEYVIERNSVWSK